MTDINDFFTSWKEISTQTPKRSGQWENKLKLEIGNQYLVRFVPYLKEGKSGYNKTTYKFITYAWRSVIDGRWIYCMSPKTWGERCPISEYYFKMKESEDPVIQEKIKKLSFKRGCYYNVYVVSDPVNSENEGKVKILQASKQLEDEIRKSISDDPTQIENNREELGVEDLKVAMFDLSNNGINLCIDVQDQGGFANYKSSKFVRRRRTLNLSPEEISNIHEQAFDLTTIDQHRTPEEVAELFETTFLGRKPEATKAEHSRYTPDSPSPKVVSKQNDSTLVDIDALDDYLSSAGDDE